MILSLRNETIATIESLIDEVKAINTNFKKLQADVGVVKTVDNLSMKKSVEIERQCWASGNGKRSSNSWTFNRRKFKSFCKDYILLPSCETWKYLSS